MRRQVRSGAEYWIAYSDVLGNLLLVFVLVLVTAMANLGEQVKELDASRLVLVERERALEDRGRKLKVAVGGVAERDRELAALRGRLEEQERASAELNASLEESRKSNQLLSVRKDAELSAAASRISSLAEELGATRSEAESARAERDAANRKLLDMVGVRRSIVEALRSTLAIPGSTASLSIDGASGAVRLGDGVLFDEGKDAIRPEAGPVLRKFLEQYLSALLGNPASRAHLARIEIEGHTNDNGTFEANLDLSYRRARAVLAFLLAQQFPHHDDLRALVSITGRSFSDPVKAPDGSVDKAKSRRIEVKFRLRDG